MPGKVINSPHGNAKTSERPFLKLTSDEKEALRDVTPKKTYGPGTVALNSNENETNISRKQFGYFKSKNSEKGIELIYVVEKLN